MHQTSAAVAPLRHADCIEQCPLSGVLAELDDGDVVIVTRLDRLARSTRDLLNTLAAIGAAKATFRSLHDAWADTATPHGRLILTVVGGLAEFERHPIVGPYRRGPQARQGPWCAVRPPVQTDAAPAPRSHRAPRRWRRDADRHRPFLQRQPQHDQPLGLDWGLLFLGVKSSRPDRGCSKWGNIPQVSWPRRLDVSATAWRGSR
jgi:hypothetical protein